jgi:hypothetical protein
MKKIVIFDYDETLILGETPEGETLSGFYRRNTFLNNLFYKKTNLVKYAREEKAKGNLIVICTAREKRFWLKAVLILKGIPCDILIERKKGDKTPSGILKKAQLLKLIISDNKFLFLDKEFYDDSETNLLEVSKLNIKVYDAKKLA